MTRARYADAMQLLCSCCGKVFGHGKAFTPLISWSGLYFLHLFQPICSASTFTALLGAKLGDEWMDGWMDGMDGMDG